jgi:hypothetical protein
MANAHIESMKHREAAARLRVGDAFAHINGHLDNLFWELLREVLDARAALAAPDHDGARRGSVQEDRKVHLARELHLARDVERVHGLACNCSCLEGRMVKEAVRMACARAKFDGVMHVSHGLHVR